METVYEIIKKYGKGKGEATMWKSVAAISDAVEKFMEPEEKAELLRGIYTSMTGGHYDANFAMEDVKRLYYTDETGTERHAPYWTEDAVRAVYDTVVGSFPSEYNFWDFFVTINMIKSDYCPMLKQWFPNATDEEMTKKIVEMTVNWLDDEDSPFGTEKIWRYMNSR